MADKESIRYGIGEWFGRRFADLTMDDRIRFVDQACKKATDKSKPICPFRTQDAGKPKLCNKAGGVCSLVKFKLLEDGRVEVLENEPDSYVCLCPERFKEDKLISNWIGKELLNSQACVQISEIGFLESSKETGNQKKVGKIDLILMHPDTALMKWCAVEIQAVYFSGDALEAEFSHLIDPNVVGVPFPQTARRPDFRSSGPKRLLPQLQIKGPTLSRWGKKLAVVVDAAFFSSLAKMETVADSSNADIAWFVVQFAPRGAVVQMQEFRLVFTTLEKAVAGLTAGFPISREEFEKEIRNKLAKNVLASNRKPIK